MSIFNRKRKQADTKLLTLMFEGVPYIGKNTEVLLVMLDDKLEIKIISPKPLPFHIDYSQIINMDYLSEREMVARAKVVDDCAFVDGLLLGEIKDAVSGIIGECDRDKLRKKVYFVINYKSFDNDEIKVVSFLDLQRGQITEKFLKELKEKTGLIDK